MVIINQRYLIKSAVKHMDVDLGLIVRTNVAQW